ncbi:SUKH-4 family immunity protein [Streptomyces sp. NPDC019990]|uniref:SUKH-4 family immunity protein n=1 Tax=Streptomyces sp. NPDC019990 TaxID=3154693 RepID=UPI0033D83A9F
MVTFAQAQERAEEWINGDVPSYQHREVRVREFDLGFVVWAEDRADGPRSDGGAQRLVIARDSGEATLWPGLPVGEVIRRYEEEYGRPGVVEEPAVAPPARVDLNQTSFLLTPPEWLQDAADKLGIADRREGGAGAASVPAAASAGEAPVGGAVGGPAGGSGSGSGTLWPAAGGSAPGAGGGSAEGASDVPAGATPWAGTDTNGDAGDDRSVPLPATVFAPPLGEAEGETPPSATPDAETALMSGGSALPPTAVSPTVQEPGTQGGAGAAGAAGVPGAAGPMPGAVPAAPGGPGYGYPPAPGAGAGPDAAAGGPGTPPGGVPRGSTPPSAPGGQPYGYPQGVAGRPGSTPAPHAGDIADAATSKAAPPPGRRGAGPATPPPPGVPGVPGVRPGGASAPSGPGAPDTAAGGYVPTQFVSAPGPEGGGPGGAGEPGGPVSAGGSGVPGGAPGVGGAMGPGVPMPPQQPPVPPGAPQPPSTPPPPGAPNPPGAPGTSQPPGPANPPGTPPGGVDHAARMPADHGRPGPGVPPPPRPPGPPGASQPPGPANPPGAGAAPGMPGGGPGSVHHAETVLATPPVGGPGVPPPPQAPGAPPAAPGAPGAPGVPGGPPPMPPGAVQPGAVQPPGVQPPGAMQPPGVQPPGAMQPPGVQPPGAMPPGPVPSGAVPPPGQPASGQPPVYGYPQPPTGQPTVGPGYQAVLRYRAQDGSEQQLIRRSAPGTPHPEWQIFHELRGMNVPPDQVLELHTELESCELPGAYCARMIREQWPQARITSIAPYGADHASRQQGMRQLLAHQGELHQVADGPARPAPVRAPLPPVQAVPPIPPEGVAQELGAAFGPGLFRFEQAAVSRQGVPPIVAHTLVVAGLPLDMGPFFWAQAQPGRPVPTLAELAAERGVQPSPDAGSYLVMGSDFGKAICVQYGTANIVAVPVEAGPGGVSVPPQFVNTGLPEFARCLALLGRMWRLRFGLNQEQAGRWTVDFQAQLAALDPAALGSPESWWSVLLEQMWDGLL